MITRYVLFLLVGYIVFAFHGCGDIRFTMDGYKMAVQSGLDKIPEARQFDDIFGKENVDHFIGYSGNRNDCTWNSEVFIEGRYKLTMQVTVKLGRSFNEVLEVIGDPVFYMFEIGMVREINGQIGAFMVADFERSYGHFGRVKWSEIYRSNGDFSAAGIPLKIGVSPVPDFAKYVVSIRQGRVLPGE